MIIIENKRKDTSFVGTPHGVVALFVHNSLPHTTVGINSSIQAVAIPNSLLQNLPNQIQPVIFLVAYKLFRIIIIILIHLN